VPGAGLKLSSALHVVVCQHPLSSSWVSESRSASDSSDADRVDMYGGVSVCGGPYALGFNTPCSRGSVLLRGRFLFQVIPRSIED
jgi:hypothetical protein